MLFVIFLLFPAFDAESRSFSRLENWAFDFYHRDGPIAVIRFCAVERKKRSGEMNRDRELNGIPLRGSGGLTGTDADNSARQPLEIAQEKPTVVMHDFDAATCIHDTGASGHEQERRCLDRDLQSERERRTQ
jgi:hypothetical protein